MLTKETIFFPRIRRRIQYRKTRVGEYYSDYTEYRQEIREDCLGRCVYCDCHENELGGEGFMNLDHFQPKKYEEFEHLINNPTNLLWACRVCNQKKWEHWPALGTDRTFVDNEGFVDPFKEDRKEYFNIRDDGEIVALKPPAEYIQNLLVFNRPTPKLRRKFRYQAYQLLPVVKKRIDKLMKSNDLTDEERELLELLKATESAYKDKLDFNLR